MLVAVTVLATLSLSVTSTQANEQLAQSGEACVETADSDCLRWQVRSFAFSPDNRYLFFSYRYLRQARPVSTWTLVRIDLQNGLKANRPTGSCGLAADSAAVSPDGKSLVIRVWTSPYDKYIGVLDLETGAISRVASPDPSPDPDILLPVFSPSGSEIYYLARASNSQYFLRAVNLKTDEVTKIFPDPPKPTCVGKICGVETSNRDLDNVIGMRMAPDGKSIVLLANRIVSKEAYDDLPAKAVLEFRDLSSINLFFVFDLDSRSLRPHSIDYTFLDEIKIANNQRFFERFDAKPDGTIYFSLAGAYKVSENFIYTYGEDGQRRPVFELTQDGQRIGPVHEFRISPDSKWVAYAYTSIGDAKTRTLPFDKMVIGRGNGQERQKLDLGGEAFQKLAFNGCG